MPAKIPSFITRQDKRQPVTLTITLAAAHAERVRLTAEQIDSDVSHVVGQMIEQTLPSEEDLAKEAPGKGEKPAPVRSKELPRPVNGLSAPTAS